MTFDNVISTIDAEIARLQQARALLASTSTGTFTAPAAPKKARRKGRTLNAEGRKRIAEAQRKRWAARRAKG